MNKTNIIFAVGLICCLLFSGCIFIVAGVGVLGGYAISKDTIQGETDKNFLSIWDSSLDILKVMGLVYTEHKSKGTLEAKVNSSDVKIVIEELTVKTTRLRVSARKYLFPDISLAQKIYIKVIENAR